VKVEVTLIVSNLRLECAGNLDQRSGAGQVAFGGPKVTFVHRDAESVD
jgi:hypothetical protein